MNSEVHLYCPKTKKEKISKNLTDPCESVEATMDLWLIV